MLKEIIALAATGLVVSSYIPQIHRAYKTKKLDDVSMIFLVIIALGVSLWIIYALLNKDNLFFISNIVLLIFALALISMKIKYRGGLNEQI